MTTRMIALVVDDASRTDIDLVRALYDGDTVEATPPYVPLIDPFEEGTPTDDLVEMIGLIIALHKPFMLELAQPRRYFDGDRQLLQFLARQGADESQSLAQALYRDVFPHHRPTVPADTPLATTALTVGRFDSPSDADKAVIELKDKSYFLVMTKVGLLEQRKVEGELGPWTLQATLELGNMIETGV